MGLKTCSISVPPRGAFFCALMAALLALTACARVAPAPEPEPETGLPAPAIVGVTDDPGQAPDSRTLASHSLTREGFRLLEQKDYDGAIRVLERAVGINPGDGPAYFYLAEAWMGRKNFKLASQFNGLAALYLRNDPAWSRRAGLQKERIEKAGKKK
ncbi:MAG: tetratricopeptide repeat protein [Thermodesulfobacteriota bacterium]